MPGMLDRIRSRLRIGGADRDDDASRGTERSVDNTDAFSSAALHDGYNGAINTEYPPGYVKDYDEGRPRH
jgi:hypothetical protein